jgi:tetratricopeptide (TPR) repeat protein
LALLLCGSAGADEVSEAKAHYIKGTNFYDLGQYREAGKEYEEAFKLKNDPVLLFNIAQCNRLAGDKLNAVKLYRAYLRRMPKARNRGEVEQQIATLQKLIDDERKAQITPPVGTLSPDGNTPPEPVQETPPTTATAPPPPAAPPAAVTVEKPAPENTPIYKKWWLWTAVAAVAVVGVAVGVGVAYGIPKDASYPAGTLNINLH